MRISILDYPTRAKGQTIVDAFVEQAAQLRAEGFSRMWCSQMPYERDLLTVLAVAFREVDGIEIGTGVLPIQNQHPMLMAQRALTLNLIAGGRFILGLGMTHRVVTEDMWGIPWDKPIRRISEYLDGLLPLLAGDGADAVGETVTTRGSLVIPDATPPDVYLAALGPQMLKVAGRRLAGTMTWMTGPRTLAEHVGPTLRAAAAEAGRESDVSVVASLPISVTDDPDRARAVAAEQFAMYGHLPSYRAMLDREGYAGPEDAALIGAEEEVGARLDALRDAGVDEFVAATFDPDPEGRARTRALLRRWGG
ncbi:TIGR03564 family F420-dependent LLM class oxidoreductase [Mycobacterium sp. ACS4331]|uniref:TIGR03564 family F420-dependent LLM class oxidoreductase n=1 Tax=Mycobacterium sp. ACS4331 TaxID=1834121 RepID=UPI0007FC9C79|nr:TIGR03564 family F420-dependent LLM class oxidoreductase [Mycobacterium sp. ACS4331]OBF25414.1 LLM class F420-dependent oxidoreductase [Mycobacterium sp. ACS4331]